MLEKWYNFKESRPEFKHEKYGVEYSDPVLFMINGTLRYGFYTSQVFINEKYEEQRDEVIELATVSFTLIQDDYKYPECLGYDEFDNLEIYWSQINLIDILLSIDLLKKEKEKKDAVKTERNINGQGSNEIQDT